MKPVNVPFAKLAEIALSVMGQAQIKADDDTIALVQGARSFLHAVVQGSLVVQAVPTEAASTASAAGPARMSDGVVPAPARRHKRESN